MPLATNYEDLVEELTIQEVILESLLEEEFTDVEDERQEAREEIARIKKRLKALAKRNAHAARPATASTSERSRSAVSRPWPPSQQTQPPPPKIRRLSASSPPGSSQYSTSAFAPMITPRKALEPTDGDGLATLSPQSRKRNGSLADMQERDGFSKSRRITPVWESSPFGSPRRDVDIIDLTGSDVDADSTVIAEQIKQESRHRQENKDREMAMFLSGQDPDYSPPTAATAGPSGSNRSAFTRMMAAQKSNSPGSQVLETEASDDDDVIETGSLRMPGAFNTQWNQSLAPPSYNLPVFGQTSTPQPSRLTQVRQLSSSPFTGTSGAPLGLGTTMPHVISLPPTGFKPASSFAVQPAVTLASQGSLQDIINRTSAFNYASGLDEFGNALPDRLRDYLSDSFHDPSVLEKDLDDLLKNITPDMDIPELSREGTPEGLKSRLYPHQILALNWMRKMEEGTNKGGILADDMGLGKTISTLSLMLSRQATSRSKTNLIIGPLSLIRQWEDEILKKTKPSHRLSVYVHHNKKATTDDLLRYDVVLTTYGTIAQELKRLDKFMEDNADRNIDYNDKSVSTKFPLLNPRKAVFYRVILDEAQCIKNRNTITAKACHQLRATYRWCLTGTPMMNGVLELFSLLVFLRIKPYSVWEKFISGFGTLFGRTGDSRGVAMTRLQALLKAIMLRRKKDSVLDGKPILNLPSKTEEVVYAELSQDERDFYNQLEKRSQVQFSKYLRDGSIGKNYSSILVLLLRLRQACCHPHLNLDVDDASSLISDKEMMKVVKDLDEKIVNRIKDVEVFECPICYDFVPSPSFFVPCGHDSCAQCLTRIVDSAGSMNIHEGRESDRAKCPVCRTQFDPKKCFTYEAFQKVHMTDTIEAQEEDTVSDTDSSDDELEEEIDTDEVDKNGNLRGFIIEDGLDNTASRRDMEKKRKGKKKAEIKPSMLKSLRKEASKNKAAYSKYMGYMRRNWLPAAKVSECIQLIQEIRQTGEKTIVFSQWTLLLDLIEVGLWHDKFEGEVRRYDGSMSSEQRFSSAQEFRDKQNVTVMLVSLRAGNAGLNLTAASRVIIMDPFWNPYIERQAVDRAYRIGQHKEVKVYRILTKGTVEDRIVELQERKKEMVEAALDEAEGVKIARLDVGQLKFLFNTRG